MITERMKELMLNGVRYELNEIQDKINYGVKRLEKLKEENKTFKCEEDLQDYLKKVEKIENVIKKLEKEYKEKSLLITDISLDIYDELV